MYPFDESLFDVHINAAAVKQSVQLLKTILPVYDVNSKIDDLLFAINCIDLTTLGGDDATSNVWRLCWRANNPLCDTIVDNLKKLNKPIVTTGAVCVYPLRVEDCRNAFEKIGSNLPIASVVAGFPAGQGPSSSTISEIQFAVESGASEIDIVINRTLVLSGNWRKLYEDISNASKQCKQCGAHLKVILSYGELGTLENVYKASMCAMIAGADFVKTSTGKESINATLAFGFIMTRAIRDFYFHTGHKVGLKPAGGLKTANDALLWVNLVRTQLGQPWMTNKMFRIGASSLLTNIEREILLLLQINPNTKVSF